MAVDEHTAVRRRDGVISEAVHEDVVLLDPQTSRFVRLNGTSARLWEALSDAPATVGALAEILRELGAPRDVALRDAAAFTTAMSGRGLVELVPRA